MRLLFAESSVRGYGTEQHIAALATAMARRGHDVRCLVIAGSPVATLLHEAQVPMVSIRPGPTRGMRIAAALLRLAVRQRPDWMVSNDPRFYRMLLAVRRLTGSRVALFRHWHDAPAKPRSRDLLSRRSDRFILVSRFHREDYQRQGMSVERASVLYNPIDTGRFRPSPAARLSARVRLGLADSHLVVGYVGRMIAGKGIFTLADAAERFLPADASAHMLWVGDGADCAALRARIEQSAHASRHRFLGWEGDPAALYPALDVLAVPSIYPEPFGRVSVEAQAAAVPVISSLVGGLPETFVADSTGIGVAPGDADALASAVLALMGDPERRRRMGAAGRDWVSGRFSLERIGEDFECLLAGATPRR
ncbi:MAG TPA: glycosyltransferase family 4 protein [Steroidobacteraceae bacterium]|jgi:glycosyltransferase involved in cell wall biosynthesis|nr:glycosyltransferase family 4 protein [Steroidobacteraceae bacterium]